MSDNMPILPIALPFVISAALSCSVIALAAFYGAKASGAPPNVAAMVAVCVVLCCSLSAFGWRAFARWRCPDGCRNVLAGPDPE